MPGVTSSIYSQERNFHKPKFYHTAVNKTGATPQGPVSLRGFLPVLAAPLHDSPYFQACFVMTSGRVLWLQWICNSTFYTGGAMQKARKFFEEKYG